MHFKLNIYFKQVSFIKVTNKVKLFCFSVFSVVAMVIVNLRGTATTQDFKDLKLDHRKTSAK